ncbi:cellulose synthase/poly-beta-1,6-N-acetylglucosamine synthase-like glycosyltransferase [Amorphus suaedae]
MATDAETGLRLTSQLPESLAPAAPSARTGALHLSRRPPRPRPSTGAGEGLSGDRALSAFAARFGLPVADAKTLALTEADALDLVPQVARARIAPLRIGSTPAGPLVALALECAREIAPEQLRALARGAPGRLMLTREATLRHAVAGRIGAASPQALLAAALRFSRMPPERPPPPLDTDGARVLTAAESEAMAAWLGLPFARSLAPEPDCAFARLVAERPDRLCAVRGDAGPLLAIAPDIAQLPNLGAAACRRTAAAGALVLTDPATIRAARRSRTPARVPAQVPWDHGLPAALSARAILSPVQRTLAPPIVVAAAVALVEAPETVPLAANLFTGFVLLGLAAVRGVASMAVVPDRPRPLRPLADHALPTYSILVPLYREASSVAALIASLRRLDYPRDRLDVLYLLEPDDAETRAAFDAVTLPPGHRVVVVPSEGPRTKPKALNVGLALASGELVTIFDAEDRPERGQLRLAAETFAAGGDRLACLQARLAIDHARDTWITRMFAIEYACLFDVLLPWLAARGLFFPLGGTSNHFRRDILLRLGAWDPYNVTEDADLGVRLTRFDYEMGMLASTTYEEAPLHMRAWLRQRTRWLKGWTLTWLVHMRRPGHFGRRRALAKMAVFQALILGSLLAILAFPLCLCFIAAHLAGVLPLIGAGGTWATGLCAFNAAVFVLGYSATVALSLKAIRLRGLSIARWRLIELPAYWLVMAAALALALVELVRRPHHWSKTRHGIARRPLRPGRDVWSDAGWAGPQAATHGA